MKKYLWQLVLGVYFLAYSLATILQSDFWGDILAPWGALTAAVILFYAAKRSERLGFLWFCLGLGCVCYGLADIAWAGCDFFLGIDPEEQAVIQWLYFGTNIAMVVIASLYACKITQKLNKLQLLLDVLAISVSSAIFFWIIFMHGDWHSFMTSGDLLVSLTMLTDFFILIALAVWMLSANIGAITSSIYLVYAGIALYSLIDLIWSYLSFYELYVPNTPIDSVYVLSLLLLALGAGASLQQNTASWSEAFYAQTHPVGYRRNAGLLLLFPMLLVVIEGWDYQNFAWMASIFLIHGILSSFVQNAVKSEQLRENEQCLARSQDLEVMANQDSLTSLPNRRLFLERLEMACQHHQAAGLGFAVVFLDIDGFKNINDTYGHDIGDLLLIEISQSFLSSIRKKDTMARLGGDEFVLLFSDLNDELELKGIVRRLRNIFSAPFKINDCICPVGVSIGVSKCPEDGVEAEALMKIADKRMYKEKISKKFKNYRANSY